MFFSDDCVYTHGCRCGGTFSISKEEVEEETCRMKKGDDEEEETEEEEHRGMVVCCDTCSLSVLVTWLSNKNT